MIGQLRDTACAGDSLNLDQRAQRGFHQLACAEKVGDWPLRGEILSSMRSHTCGTGSSPPWWVPTARREGTKSSFAFLGHTRDHVPPGRV